jgi:hypothetical protein
MLIKTKLISKLRRAAMSANAIYEWTGLLYEWKFQPRMAASNSAFWYLESLATSPPFN